MSSPRSTSKISTNPLTKEQVYAQMRGPLNSPRARQAEINRLRETQGECTRPVSASSSEALEQKEKEEQKINDVAIAASIKDDEEKGPLPEPTKEVTNKHCHMPHGKNINFSQKVKQGPEARLAKVNPEVTESVLSSYLDDKDLGRLSTSCVTLYRQTAGVRARHVFPHYLQYLQAVIFNDKLTVSSMLRSHPNFLLAKPEDYGIEEVTCQHTWLTYLTKGESAFSMAQKLGHIDVVNAMFPYYQNELKVADKYKNQSRVTELEDMWIMLIPNEAQQKALQDLYIDNLILPMIQALAADTTIQSGWDIRAEEARFEHISEGTLKAWQALRNQLFRPKLMQDCIDVDQFLIAVYKAYDIHYDTFRNLTKREAFVVLVMGLAQSLVGRGLAEIYCRGLDYVVRRDYAINADARALRLWDGRSFYREKRDGSGLGLSCFCNIWGQPSQWHGVMHKENAIGLLEDYIKEKHESVPSLRSNCSNNANKLTKKNRGV